MTKGVSRRNHLPESLTLRPMSEYFQIPFKLFAPQPNLNVLDDCKNGNSCNVRVQKTECGKINFYL